MLVQLVHGAYTTQAADAVVTCCCSSVLTCTLAKACICAIKMLTVFSFYLLCQHADRAIISQSASSEGSIHQTLLGFRHLTKPARAFVQKPNLHPRNPRTVVMIW